MTDNRHSRNKSKGKGGSKGTPTVDGGPSTRRGVTKSEESGQQWPSGKDSLCSTTPPPPLLQQSSACSSQSRTESTKGEYEFPDWADDGDSMLTDEPPQPLEPYSPTPLDLALDEATGRTAALDLGSPDSNQRRAGMAAAAASTSPASSASGSSQWRMGAEGSAFTPYSTGSASTARVSCSRQSEPSPLQKSTVGLRQTMADVGAGGKGSRKRELSVQTVESSPAQGGNSKKSKLNNDGYDDEKDDYIFREDEVWNNRFEIGALLGKGSFGQVVAAFDRQCGVQVAIKVIKNRQSFYKQAQLELQILDLLNTHNATGVVRKREQFMHRNHLCIVYERLGLNLYEALRKRHFAGFSLALIRRWGRQVLASLSFLARPEIQVIHCDLKPENILLHDDGKKSVKVIDFGSSCFHNERTYTYIQSRFYRSPEVILSHPYTTAVDMWSLGCILYELVNGEPLFPGRDECDQMARMVEMLGIPPLKMLQSPKQKKVHKLFAYQHGRWMFRGTKTGSGGSCPIEVAEGSDEQATGKQKLRGLLMKKMGVNAWGSGITRSDWTSFVDLVVRMLEYDPEKRVTPDQALSHPFFRTTAASTKSSATHLDGVRNATEKQAVEGRTSANTPGERSRLQMPVTNAVPVTSSSYGCSREEGMVRRYSGSGQCQAHKAPVQNLYGRYSQSLYLNDPHPDVGWGGGMTSAARISRTIAPAPLSPAMPSHQRMAGHSTPMVAPAHPMSAYGRLPYEAGLHLLQQHHHYAPPSPSFRPPSHQHMNFPRGGYASFMYPSPNPTATPPSYATHKPPLPIGSGRQSASSAAGRPSDVSKDGRNKWSGNDHMLMQW
ncbi:Dual specificity tyrosine-phosphorylation-regulated kinase 1A [Borealophlyctis nickersoniae]|nr:Dual specificity tyrosine-phosphorylation-regulated kinase 1A [Borealophlyctis nickersoniae]